MKYEIVRSDRRTVSITVKGDRVILRGPIRLSDADAEKIIASHEKWILDKLEKQKNRKNTEIDLSESEISNLKKEAKKYFKENQ